MVTLIVATRDGTGHEIEGDTSLTVMENIRDAGFDELLAPCGGWCSCATCHVHVEGGDALSLPAISEDENDLLDSTTDRDDNSCLSCQVPFSDAPHPCELCRRSGDRGVAPLGATNFVAWRGDDACRLGSRGRQFLHA